MRIHRYDPEHVQLRKELKAIRLAAGLSQEQLADLLGTKQFFVSRYERGERNLDYIEVLRVCKACNFDQSKLAEKLDLKATS